jgi:hypothetical protein
MVVRQDAFLGAPKYVEVGRLSGPMPVTLSEPNVLVLDRAEWRLNAGEWHPCEEVLRVENLVRASLGLGRKTGSIAQPWTDTAPDPILGDLRLRFEVVCEAPVAHPKLAMEDVELRRVLLDGKPVESKVDGWYIDEAIQTLVLPSLAVGKHFIEVSIPYSRKRNVEVAYLLGDFGVRVEGVSSFITGPVRQLAIGDWVHQGLPFYGGNVTYHASLVGGDQVMALHTPHFGGALVTVAVDGARVGPIAFEPYRLELGTLSGKHSVDVTVLGHRRNIFGPLHLRNDNERWIGPGAWRSEGVYWSDEYYLKPMGLLVAPRVLARKS